MALELTFLGTGTSQGVPVIACECPVCRSGDERDKRLRTSVMISGGSCNVIIDIGPDFRMQMLREEVEDIEGIILTHQHNDHVVGLDDVRPFNFKWKKDIPIYGTAEVLDNVKNRFAYIFDLKPYPGTPRLNLMRIKPYEAFELGGMDWLPLPVFHGSMPVLGFRTGDITYITDANEIPEKTLEAMEGTRILVLNALHRRKHHAHFNLEEAVEMTRRINPERAYFTHISHRMGLYREIEQQLPGDIHLAYDGLKLSPDE